MEHVSFRCHLCYSSSFLNSSLPQHNTQQKKFLGVLKRTLDDFEENKVEIFKIILYKGPVLGSTYKASDRITFESVQRTMHKCYNTLTPETPSIKKNKNISLRKTSPNRRLYLNMLNYILVTVIGLS